MSEELKEENKRLRLALGVIAKHALYKILQLPPKNRNKNNMYFLIAGTAITALAGYVKQEKKEDE